MKKPVKFAAVATIIDKHPTATDNQIVRLYEEAHNGETVSFGTVRNVRRSIKFNGVNGQR